MSPFACCQKAPLRYAHRVRTRVRLLLIDYKQRVSQASFARCTVSNRSLQRALLSP